MRGRVVVAWQCTCRSGARAATVVVVMLILLGMALVAESTRVREMVVAAIDLQGETSSVADEYNSVQVTTTTTRATTMTTRRASSSEGHSRGERVVEDPVWDVEDESPPAQRQRDRSLWGMSKRLVPTGPNPLHN